MVCPLGLQLREAGQHDWYVDHEQLRQLREWGSPDLTLISDPVAYFRANAVKSSSKETISLPARSRINT